MNGIASLKKSGWLSLLQMFQMLQIHFKSSILYIMYRMMGVVRVAGQRKQTGQPNLTDDEKKFNRQINFLVMRTMWQELRGRAKKGSEGQTIYAAFHMSRERYTRIIRGEPVRFSKEELKRLMVETGVRSEIFEGKDCFHFEAISHKDWKKLFDLRDVDIKKAKVYEKNLYGQMAPSDVDLLKNPDLYYFAVYLKSGKPATDMSIEEDLSKGVNWLNSVRLAQLERCRLEVLREYVQGLEKQLDIAGSLLRYMELKQQGK